AACALAAQPAGERWRLTFARPLTQRVTLTLETPLEKTEKGGQKEKDNPPLFPPPSALRPPPSSWEVPLVTVLGADRMEGDVALHLAGAELLQVQTAGLRETGRDSPGRPADAGGAAARRDTWRLFCYGRTLAPGELPRLRVAGRPATTDRPAREVCDRSELVSYVEPSGRLLHHFRFRVWHWHQRDWQRDTLSVLLPPGAAVLAARVEGRWLDRVGQREGAGGVEAQLPVP